MRVCIVAEHASKKFGGEAIIPVHYFRLLRSLGIEAWMVVHARTQTELAELFPQDKDRILFVPDLWIHRLLFDLCRHLPRRLSEGTLGLFNQLITQFYQRKIVRQLILDKGIDVIHQPIPVSPRFPSLLYGLGVPVLMGPLNGGMEFPPAFRRTEPQMSRLAVAVARLLANAGNTLLPGKKRASAVLVANDRTRRALPKGIRGSVIELAENGIDVGIWHGPSDEPESTVSASAAPRFVFLGRLVDWKAADVVIRAIRQVPTAELELIGDGPMMESWRNLAGELGLTDRVHFTGWLPQEQCPARLRTAVALVLPSLFECGGAVVLEAMAMGKPVIATNWGGPADYLDATCGILVEPENYQALVAGFAEAMQKLIDTPGLARAMGAAGRERVVRDFDWQRKIEQVIRIYRALAEKSDLFREFEDNRVSPVTVSEHHLQ